MVSPCLSLRVENRPSVLGIFIYVPWGGVGWGNNVHVLAHSHDVTPRQVHLHVRTYVMLRWRCVTSRRGGVGWGGAITFTYLRTPMMLRHGRFTCTCAHTSCYVEDVSRHAGVGWGNNEHVLAHSHDVTPRQVHLHVRTYVMLRWRCVTWRRGGVGWGNNVHVLASVPDQLTSCPENEQKLNDLIWTYVRTWQWRWEANVVGKALLESTWRRCRDHRKKWLPLRFWARWLPKRNFFRTPTCQLYTVNPNENSKSQ